MQITQVKPPNLNTQVVNILIVACNFVLILFLLKLFLPPISYAQECQNNTLNEGLISAKQGINPTTKFGNSASVCITGDNASYREFKVPQYQDLEDQFYTFNRSTAKKSAPPNFTGGNSGNGIYLQQNDLTVSGAAGTGTQVIFVRGNLDIADNIDYADTDSSSGLVFIVKGNINIYSGVTKVNAVLISSGIICTSYVTSPAPVCSDGSLFTNQLVINGSLISLNKDPGIGRNAIEFRRNLEVNDRAAEVINKQPKYLYILRNGLFTKDLVVTTEDKHYQITTTATAALSVNGSCSPDPTSGSLPNAQTTWRFTPNSIGGSGIYNYIWSGSDNLSGEGTSPSINKTYTEAGPKIASLVISDLGSNPTLASNPVTCSNFIVNPASTPIAGSLPPGWTGKDIGNPTPTGNSSYSADNWTVAGGGDDIWNNWDFFHYAYRNDIVGNYTITAKVDSITNTNEWAKTGVMIRDGIAANARHAAIFLTPGPYGVSFQVRADPDTMPENFTTGSSSTLPMAFPVWLRIIRSGNDFSGYYSADGTNWTQVGPAKTINNMPATATGGLAVTSHNNGVLNTSTFSNVDVAPLPPPCDVNAVGTNQLVGCYWNWDLPSNYFETLVSDADPGPQLASPYPNQATILDLWSTGPNLPGGAETFAATWKGNYTFEPGTYDFSGGSDDGLRVKLLDQSGTLLAQSSDTNWTNRGYTETPLFSYTFNTQTSARVIVDFFENTGDQKVKVWWDFTPGVPNLTAWWRMDESSWTRDCLSATAKEEISNGAQNAKSCPGSLGPNTTIGQGGFWKRAGEFDGTDDYLQAAAPTNSIITNFTFTAWVKRNFDNDFGAIISKTDNGTNTDYDFAVCGDSRCNEGLTNNDNKVMFYGQPADGTTAVTAISDGSITGNAWHFVAAVRSGLVLTFYIDGVPAGSRLVSGDLFNRPSLPIRIGTDNWGTQAQFKGQIDDVRIYDRALSGTEISTIMNATPAPQLSYRVFVTDNLYTGDLQTAGSNVGLGTASSGLNGADKLCQAAANGAALGGTWKAWLSDDSTSASSRLNQSAFPSILLNGAKVADSWADLTDGTLQNGINITQTGATVPNSAFTNTNTSGNITSPPFSCNNWTYVAGSTETPLYRSARGIVGATDATWTTAGGSNVCSAGITRRLYCLEQ